MTGLWAQSSGDKPRWYSVQQVADLLGEHPQTTYHRLRCGELRGKQYRKGGRWFIRAEEVDAFVDPSA